MRDGLALALVAVCAACSGEGESGGDGSGIVLADLAVHVDFARPDDLSPLPDGTAPPDFSGINCGAQTCAAGSVCCATPGDPTPTYACAASCADGGLTIACDGSDNCRSGAGDLCCATLLTHGGTAPFCDVTAFAACADTCVTQMPATCNADPGTARLCHRAADCASDTQNPNCCRFTWGGNDVTFCAGQSLKSAAVACFN